MAGKGGGAWKVAYADFVTAMMAFFMVMWITGQNKDVKEAVAGYFNDPHLFSGNPPGGTSPMPSKKPGSPLELKRLRQRSKDKGRGYADRGNKLKPSDNPEEEINNANMLVLHDGDQASDGTVVLFTEDSAELSEPGQQRLKQLVPILRGKPNKIEIRGHSSRRPLPAGGPYRDTWELCFARCLATMKYLEQAGLEPSRMRMSQAGVFEPHTIQTELERQALNSRVEVYSLGEIAEDFLGTRAERAKRFSAPGEKPPIPPNKPAGALEAAKPRLPTVPSQPPAAPHAKPHGKSHAKPPAKPTHAKPHAKSAHAKPHG